MIRGIIYTKNEVDQSRSHLLHTVIPPTKYRKDYFPSAMTTDCKIKAGTVQVHLQELRCELSATFKMHPPQDIPLSERNEELCF
jgi:hypothetical protein